MKYLVGFDGGGTKTRCIIGDLEGNIVSDLTSTSSNYQVIGINKAKQVIENLFADSIECASISKEDIDFVFLGLSGADLEYDFEILYSNLNSIFNDIPFTIENDTWIMLRSGLKEKYGAVSLYGTGANAAALGLDGKKAILRALEYMHGGFGGGMAMTEAAFHYAFRSDEGTYKKTLLEEYLPKVLGLNNIEDVLFKTYPTNTFTIQEMNKIPPLVFELSNKGDVVCQEILMTMGKIQGEMTSGIIKKASLQNEKFPIVVGGSIFKGNSPLFINSMLLEIHKTAPYAYVVYPEYPPVIGAYFYGLDKYHSEIPSHVYENINKSILL